MLHNLCDMLMCSIFRSFMLQMNLKLCAGQEYLGNAVQQLGKFYQCVKSVCTFHINSARNIYI